MEPELAHVLAELNQPMNPTVNYPYIVTPQDAVRGLLRVLLMYSGVSSVLILL